MSRTTGERRRGREYALQLLFQLDLAPQDTQTAIEQFWLDKPVVGPVQEFAEQIVCGTMQCRDGIDAVLAGSAFNWRVSRMPVVDRNILRMAIYEFLFFAATPRVVVIDEAIEIAKKFGNEESAPFINGILDAIRIKIEAGEIDLPADLAALAVTLPGPKTV
ncbi:MAG TPA: transcription antitermination factor NusB [Patescibacteria group bacterium]|nr:transcription antitermination factor NusB [Patescibacteria group bacterium]